MTLHQSKKRKTRSDKFNFTNSDMKKIEKMASLGLSISQISTIFGISTDTFYRRANEANCDLSAAITRGKSKATLAVAQKAYELAIAGDTSMIKYYLSSIAGWSEKSQLKNEDEPLYKDSCSNIQEYMDELTDEELELIVGAAMKKKTEIGN